MNTQSQNETSTQPKNAYQAPEIVDYGTVDALTQGRGGQDTDGQGGSASPQ